MHSAERVDMRFKWPPIGAFLLFIVISTCFLGNMAMACEALLTALQPHLAQVEAHRGEVVTDLKTLPVELQELIGKEGGSLAYLGGEEFGSVYRWNHPGHATIVVKYYFDPTEAMYDDFALAALRRVVPSDGYVRIIESIRPSTTSLRFFRDVHGITLLALKSRSPLPVSLMNQIDSKYKEFMTDLAVGLRRAFGSDRVIVQGSSFLIQIDFGPPIWIKPHAKNILFDSQSGHLWVIDPR